MKLHIFTTIVIGLCIASAGLFLDAFAGGSAAQTERRGPRRPTLDPQPRAAVRKLCHADRLYRLAEIETAVAQVRMGGCEEITMVHIEAGFYLFSGTFVVTSEQ